MATQAENNLYKGIPKLTDAFVVIVKTEWNDKIINELERGAVKILAESNVRFETFMVPGAVELPFAIRAYANGSLSRADAFIALGTVIRGDTPHFEYVCDSVTQGLTNLNLTLDAPVIFGVLTVNTEEQALERIGGKHGHKGEEAAVAAIKMIELKRKFK